MKRIQFVLFLTRAKLLGNEKLSFVSFLFYSTSSSRDLICVLQSLSAFPFALKFFTISSVDSQVMPDSPKVLLLMTLHSNDSLTWCKLQFIREKMRSTEALENGKGKNANARVFWLPCRIISSLRLQHKRTHGRLEPLNSQHYVHFLSYNGQ